MNTHELMECFNRQGADKIGGGVYGQVYTLPKTNHQWIVKSAKDDGTRSYLEWVQYRTRIGKRMRGMPIIDFLYARDGRYIVGMKRYKPLDDDQRIAFGRAKYEPSHYISRLIAEFEEETGVEANDCHGNNAMWDEKTKSIILTDPSSQQYVPLGTVPENYDPEYSYRKWGWADNPKPAVIPELELQP